MLTMLHNHTPQRLLWFALENFVLDSNEKDAFNIHEGLFFSPFRVIPMPVIVEEILGK